jgi:hypothetical protein
MPTAFEAQIQARIVEFVEELYNLARLSTLDSLRAVLEGSAPVRRGRPAGAKGGAGRARTAGNVEDAAARIVAHVKGNDGQGIAAIADATRVALPLAKKAVLQLLASGALKKSGVRRGTVYHAGGGKPARAKAGKRRTPKAKPVKRKAPAKPRRRARTSKRDVVIPAPKRFAPPSPKTTTTDVPAALAVR